MNNVADIKRRIESVRQTRKITGAMETISVAKMRKSAELYEQNRAYFDFLERTVNSALSQGESDIKEFLSPKQHGKKLFIVISSDKGLCGSFNHDILKTAEKVIESDSLLFPIGQTACDYFKNTCEIDDSYVSYSYSPNYSSAKKIAQKILDEYGKTVSSVWIVYSKMVGHSLWQPTVTKLFPIEIDGEKDKLEQTSIEFEPSAVEVLRHILPLYLSGFIYGALVNSATSEHCARRAAMSSSTKNADELIAALSLEYNRARQGNVTEQIIEIAGSTRALGRNGGGND